MSYTAAQSLLYITGPTGPASADQLAQAWLNAGGDVATAPTAVAIALAEQGQYAFGINSDPPGASAGAWQLHWDNWDGLQNNGIISSPNDLKNLDTNANGAIFISGNGKNWHPWTTYTSGAYLANMSRAQQAVNAVTGGSSSTSTDSTQQGPSSSGIDVAMNLAGNVFDQWSQFITSPALDVFAKALIVVIALFMVALVPATRKFAVWTAAILFLLLMLHSRSIDGATPNGQSAAPMPVPSQLGQPKITASNTVIVSGDSSGGSSSSQGVDLAQLAQLAQLAGAAG